MYAIRRVKDSFREHKVLCDPSEIQHNIQEAYKFLEIIKRQVMTSILKYFNNNNFIYNLKIKHVLYYINKK